jgi:hypothetical protein
MIIFTGDNGSLYGEHLLAGKGLAYEPSIRLPLFIRYPEWFAAGTTTSDQLGLHIDLAPTILEAAGIDHSAYHFHGKSLHDLVTGQASRGLLMYENMKLYEDEGDDEVATPSIRSVRSLHYKYVQYQCTSVTEEFFDLANDPDENTNLINDAGYAGLIENFRFKLDSLRIAFGDTTGIDTLHKSCYLSVGDKSDAVKTLTVRGDGKIFGFRSAPNPFSDSFDSSLKMESACEPVRLQLYNSLGQCVMQSMAELKDGTADIHFETAHLPAGLYYLRAENSKVQLSELMIKSVMSQ